MSTRTVFRFRERLYFDPESMRYSFAHAPGRIPAVGARVPVTLGGLVRMAARHGDVDRTRPRTLLDEEVLRFMEAEGLLPLEEPSLEPAEPAEPPPPPTIDDKVTATKERLRTRVFDKIHVTADTDVIRGVLDAEISGFVSEVYSAYKPSQVVRGAASTGDHYVETTVATQAVGGQLELSEADLFLVAKSAIINSLKQADRENIAVLKKNLLVGNQSRSFKTRLHQYYGEVYNYLRTQVTDPVIRDLIRDSQFIYYEEPAPPLTEQVLVLGIADAFTTMREEGVRLLKISDTLTRRLSLVLAERAKRYTDSVEELVCDACYNDFRESIDSRLSGGDHCEFVRLARDLVGLLIFDVSGHGERASAVRDDLVGAFRRLRDKGNPGAVATALNEHLMAVDCPQDMFVSLIYGIVDLDFDRFRYANAGHNPPYLVRDGGALRLDQDADIILNAMPTDYRCHDLPLRLGDCMVFYTDGLTEARRGQGALDLFGEERLRDTIVRRRTERHKARQVIDTILAAVRDEGFEIGDDITIQVYRHL